MRGRCARSSGWDRPRAGAPAGDQPWERPHDWHRSRTVVTSCPRDSVARTIPRRPTPPSSARHRRRAPWSRTSRDGDPAVGSPTNVRGRGRRFPARARDKDGMFCQGDLHNSRSSDRPVYFFQVKKHGCSRLHLTARNYESRVRVKYEPDGRWVRSPFGSRQVSPPVRRSSLSSGDRPRVLSILTRGWHSFLARFMRDFARWNRSAVRLCPSMCFPKIRKQFYEWHLLHSRFYHRRSWRARWVIVGRESCQTFDKQYNFNY